MRRSTTRRKDIDLARVGAAVEAGERRTSAELVVSIAPFFLGRVWTAARGAFERIGIARTRGRNGVLVFVVPARRQVVVLADEAAHAQLDPAVWRDAASGIAAAFARGDGTAGLVEGIDRLARALGKQFPRERADDNELPDQPDLGGLA
jgi:putative membrane protein